jgi:hypothetical protein
VKGKFSYSWFKVSGLAVCDVGFSNVSEVSVSSIFRVQCTTQGGGLVPTFRRIIQPSSSRLKCNPEGGVCVGVTKCSEECIASIFRSEVKQWTWRSCVRLATFQMNVGSLSSSLKSNQKMEAVRFSELLIISYCFTRCHKTRPPSTCYQS